MLAPAIQFSVCMDNGGEFLLREFAIFFYIANSCNILLRTKFIARLRNCSYSRFVLNRGPTLPWKEAGGRFQYSLNTPG